MSNYELYDQLESAHKAALDAMNEIAEAMQDLKPNPLLVILRHLAPRCERIEVDAEGEPVSDAILRDNYASPFNMADDAYLLRDCCEEAIYTFYFNSQEPAGFLHYMHGQHGTERIADYSGAGEVCELIETVMEEYRDDA